ncbi:MAG: hypothetical protein JWR85_2144 [Marmoricola sp.]|nr:hypothetical protein [Marmoricola sp.]
MADEPEKSGQEPNLELPSLLGFGRKKRSKGEPAPAQDEPTAERRGGIAPVAGTAKRLPPVPPPSAPASPDDPTDVADSAEADVPLVVEETVPDQQPPPLEPPPREVHSAAGSETANAEVTELAVGPETWAREEPEPRPESSPESSTESSTENQASVPVRAVFVEEHPDPPVTQPVKGLPVAPAVLEPAAPEGPRMNPRLAAVLTGAIVGLVGVLLAYLSGTGCEAVRGVGSCGGIGLLALLVIVAIEVVLGAAILKFWRLSDPTSTSFLGVGLVAVFVLLFLLSQLDSVWMIVVIPALSGLTFLVSWWVTETFVDPPDNLTH